MVHSLADTDLQERLHIITGPSTGLNGIIAIHSTALGPAAGGCRFWHYGSSAEMTADAIRLARGMSFKNAMAGLPFGGGKAVLQRPPGDVDRAAVFRAFGDAIAALHGEYVTAEDVGTTLADMSVVRTRTRFEGLAARQGRAGGDPSSWTALGAFESMRAAARTFLGMELRGATVAVQGAGSVGTALCHLLARAGVHLVIADIDAARAAALAGKLGAKVVGVDDILSVDAQILAPCALGGVLNSRTIAALKAQLVCGAANNQLATEADGEALRDRGIVYCPDYIVNAGGIINVSAEYMGETTAQVQRRVHQIPNRLLSVLRRANERGRASSIVADELARQIIMAARRKAA